MSRWGNSAKTEVRGVAITQRGLTTHLWSVIVAVIEISSCFHLASIIACVWLNNVRAEYVVAAPPSDAQTAGVRLLLSKEGTFLLHETWRILTIYSWNNRSSVTQGSHSAIGASIIAWPALIIESGGPTEGIIPGYFHSPATCQNGYQLTLTSQATLSSPAVTYPGMQTPSKTDLVAANIF